MNVLTTRVALRERTLSEVFDLGFRFVIVRGGRRYAKLWLLCCAPWLGLCLGLRRLHWGWELIWPVAFAGFVAAQIPFTLAASRLLLADELELGSLLRAWLLRLPGQLFSHLLALTGLAISGLVIVPLPIVALRLVFLPEIMLLEGSSLGKAYQRGTRMTQSRMPQAFQTCLLLLSVWAAFVLGAEVTGRAVQEDLLSLPAPADSLFGGGSWFALAGFFLAVPFLATARFLAYIDSRTRREAWDVQLRFTELANQPRGVG